MKNKKVKKMICDVLNYKYGHEDNLKYVWMEDDTKPCLVCFNTANFIWPNWGVASLTADQLRGVK